MRVVIMLDKGIPNVLAKDRRRYLRCICGVTMTNTA